MHDYKCYLEELRDVEFKIDCELIPSPAHRDQAKIDILIARAERYVKLLSILKEEQKC